MKTPSLYVGFKIRGKSRRAQGYFFSERKEKVEEWIARGGKREQTQSTNSGSKSDVPAASDNGEESKDQRAPEPQLRPFEQLTNRFIHSMNQFDRLIPTTLSVLPVAEMMQMNEKFYEPIAKAGASLTQVKDFELYKISLDQFRVLDLGMNEIVALRRGRSSLPGMFLMGLISSYDAFLAQLMHLIFLTKPETISSSEKNISFKDLVELGSVDAARSYLIEKEVEAFLRQSHHAQFDYLENKLGMPLRKDLDIWPRFVEICERRNLFTHTSGVVSNQYIRVCSEHDVDLGGVAVGDQLVISPKYLQDATEVISELGLKLIQVIWRKLKPGDIAVAASVLNDQAFELLIRRRYELARVMLEFGLALKKNGDELTRKMLVVNLAIATKFVETPDAALRILNNEDWTASSDKFQICVAAVKDDVVAVIKYLPNVAASGEIPKEGFRHWPAFLTVKEHPEFIKAFESAFGEAFVPDRSSSEEPPGVPQPARDDSTQDSEAEPQELTDQLKPSAKSTQEKVG